MPRNKKSIGEDKMLSAKDIMKKYSLSYQTINHYTDFGILPVSVKKGNVRFYDRRIVEERIRKTRQLMGEGYSLRLIHKKLASV